MSSNSVDPSGNTQAFRAFTQQPDPEPAGVAARSPLILIGAVALAVIVIALIAWLALT